MVDIVFGTPEVTPIEIGVGEKAYIMGAQGPKGDKGDPGTNGTNGVDGVSPTISVSTITGGHEVSITDAGGTNTFNVMDGTDGQDGSDGSDGADGTTFTPAVSSAGVISWTNDGGKTNPPSVDLAAAVEDVFVVSVSGTTPSITGVANTRYICGEVTTISITPPQSGIIDVVFTSGSPAAVLTLPNTVLMPEWFEVETDMVYEINIADGVYGSVMAWAAI